MLKKISVIVAMLILLSKEQLLTVERRANKDRNNRELILKTCAPLTDGLS